MHAKVKQYKESTHQVAVHTKSLFYQQQILCVLAVVKTIQNPCFTSSKYSMLAVVKTHGLPNSNKKNVVANRSMEMLLTTRVRKGRSLLRETQLILIKYNNIAQKQVGTLTSLKTIRRTNRFTCYISMKLQWQMPGVKWIWHKNYAHKYSMYCMSNTISC